MSTKRLSHEEREKRAFELLQWLKNLESNPQTQKEATNQLMTILKSKSTIAYILEDLRENELILSERQSSGKRGGFNILKYIGVVPPNIYMAKKSFANATNKTIEMRKIYYNKQKEDKQLRKNFPANVEGSKEFYEANRLFDKVVTIQDFAEEIQALKELYEGKLRMKIEVTINISKIINI